MSNQEEGKLGLLLKLEQFPKEGLGITSTSVWMMLLGVYMGS